MAVHFRRVISITGETVLKYAKQDSRSAVTNLSEKGLLQEIGYNGGDAVSYLALHKSISEVFNGTDATRTSPQSICHILIGMRRNAKSREYTAR